LFNVIVNSTLDDQEMIDFVKATSTSKDNNTLIPHVLNSSYTSWTC